MTREQALQVKRDLDRLAREHGDNNTAYGMLFDLQALRYDGPTPIALVREVVAQHLGACNDTTLAGLVNDFDTYFL